MRGPPSHLHGGRGSGSGGGDVNGGGGGVWAGPCGNGASERWYIRAGSWLHCTLQREASPASPTLPQHLLSCKARTEQLMWTLERRPGSAWGSPGPALCQRKAPAPWNLDECLPSICRAICNRNRASVSLTFGTELMHMHMHGRLKHALEPRFHR